MNQNQVETNVEETASWKDRFRITKEQRDAVLKTGRDFAITIGVAVAANVLIDASSKMIRDRFSGGVSESDGINEEEALEETE